MIFWKVDNENSNFFRNKCELKVGSNVREHKGVVVLWPVGSRSNFEYNMYHGGRSTWETWPPRKREQHNSSFTRGNNWKFFRKQFQFMIFLNHLIRRFFITAHQLNLCPALPINFTVSFLLFAYKFIQFLLIIISLFSWKIKYSTKLSLEWLINTFILYFINKSTKARRKVSDVSVFFF